MEYIVAALIVVLLVALLRPRPEFRIRVTDGEAHLMSGTAPGRFVGEVGEILAEAEIREATVTAIRGGRGVRLAFSRQVPDAVRQQLRNTWLTYPQSQIVR